MPPTCWTTKAECTTWSVKAQAAATFRAAMWKLLLTHKSQGRCLHVACARRRTCRCKCKCAWSSTRECASGGFSTRDGKATVTWKTDPCSGLTSHPLPLPPLVDAARTRKHTAVNCRSGCGYVPTYAGAFICTYAHVHMLAIAHMFPVAPAFDMSKRPAKVANAGAEWGSPDRLFRTPRASSF